MNTRTRDVSGAAYDIQGVLRTCVLACDPMQTIADWRGDNGIERTLEVAERLVDKLIQDIEALESELEKAKRKIQP
jgi:hypothetical protein